MLRPTRILLFVLAVTLAISLVARASEDLEAQRARLQELRKDKKQYARLRHTTKTFLDLAPVQQDRLRKLDRELHAQSVPVRERLVEVMRRYNEWLDDLDAKDQARIREAPDKYTRLQIVKELRDREWIKRLSRAVRLKLDSASNELPVRKKGVSPAIETSAFLLAPNGVTLLVAVPALLNVQTERDKLVVKLRQDEYKRRLDWHLVYRHWRHTDYNAPIPASLADFSDDVKFYVEKMLIPNLTKEENERLQKAEGRYVSASFLLDPFYREAIKKAKGIAQPQENRMWPLYPFLLVEYADRFPLALPRPVMPTRLADLFPDVERRFLKFAKLPPKFKEGPGLPKFVAQRGGPPLPHELWPSSEKGLSDSMKDFLAKELTPALSKEEAKYLASRQGRWPDYPQEIQKLAAKHNLRPPWQYLPESANWPRKRWEIYRLKPLNLTPVMPDMPVRAVAPLAN
jgi:hypothetical protein